MAVPQLELVIFDLDGVLADTFPSHARAYADLWSRLGIAGPEYGSIAGVRTRDVVARVTAGLSATDADRDEWTRFKQARARHYLAAEPNLFPDAERALAALADGGLVLAIGTASARDTVEGILARGGIRQFFRAVITADDVTAGKPAPDVFEAAIVASGRPADRAVVVEDAAAGLEAAERALAWSASVRSGIERPGPRFLGAFPDLPPVVDRILGLR